MTIPHYINEDRSEMRGIKPGWYAMDDAGNAEARHAEDGSAAGVS